ncbi:MAG: hypothetical protein ACXVFN_16975 [Solirubrobacteraceae bacterium]
MTIAAPEAPAATGPAPAPPAPAPARPRAAAPVLSALHATAGGRRAALRVSFRMSAAARVSIVVERRAACRHGRRCWMRVGAARVRDARAGRNVLTLGGRPLAPGAYRVTARPAAGRAAVVALRVRR